MNDKEERTMCLAADFFFLEESPYSTEELNEFMNEYHTTPCYCLQEVGDSLLWQGKPVPHTVYPMYLSASSTQMQWQREDLPLHKPTDGQKQVQVSNWYFYRCAQTGGKWLRPHTDHYVTLGSLNQKIDVLYLDEDTATLDTYLATSCWELEDAASQEFTYYEAGDAVTITGVRHYCERLRIPAMLGGKKVANAYLSNQLHLRNLRELEVEEGVERLSFPWTLPDLEIIRLPASVRLVCSPDRIQHTKWFHFQPDGPVYLQNFYCGTKGYPQKETLELAEGTIGVCRGADEGRSWEHITFPSSLAYIATCAVPFPDTTDQVTFSPGTEDLKSYFLGLYPNAWNSRLLRWRNDTREQRLPGTAGFTGKDLYNLGRFHPEIRVKLTWQWVSSAPRLLYKDGWIAEFWYYTPGRCTAGYYASIDLSSGKALKMRPVHKNVQPYLGFCWTDAYEPPFYLVAEDYLEQAAQLLCQTAPSHEAIVQLERWWNNLETVIPTF